MLRSTLLLAMFVASGSVPSADAQPKSIRAQAVVDLNFDEPSGNPIDRASRGSVKDAATLVNGPRRVDSPFWNQHGRRALLLNARRKHYVRLPSGPDTNRPTGATVAFFFLNLHPLNDNQTHGVFGKRIDGGKNASTSFGMNFIGRADSIRPYINDGSGFKYPDFSLRQTVGSRRLVYLTATFEITDGPGNLADNKKDDVRMRFFVNGKQVKPKRGVGGVIIRRNDAWAPKVNVKRLLNDVPLTLGSTNETIEFTSGLIDEFTLFDRALNPREVARLFREVAGKNAAKLAAAELRPPRSPVPQVMALSSHGLQIGTRSRLVISGANLGQSPQVRLPFAGVRQSLQTGSSASAAIVDVTIPKDVPAGMYPLRIQSEDGLSAPVVVAVDHLPQRPAAGSSPRKPAELPAAFFGEMSGASRQRVYFFGKKGRRIVADVEARRLGARMDPVLEIKTERGTPLVIAMGKVPLKGDARAEAVLPADGLYYADLHDLEYNAPGRNPFRLKVGDLKIVDAWYPPAVSGSGTALQPIGAGFRWDDKVAVDVKRPDADKPFLLREQLSSAPQPMVGVSDSREFTEPLGDSKGMPPIDVIFQPGSTQSVAINGIIRKPGEADRFVLNVVAGRKLRFTFLGRAIDSPIDGEVTVRSLPQRSVLARGQDRPTSRDPLVDVTAPAGAKQVEVTVRDLFGRGGNHFLYRLLVEPAGRPVFALDIASARLAIPANGSGFIQLQVRRTGYNGPIKLSIDGAKSLSLLPSTIPPGRSGPVFIVVRHRGDAKIGDFRHVRLMGQSVGLKPAVQRLARVTNRTQTVAGWESDLPMAIGESSPFSVRVAKRPPALFKGTRARAAVQVKRDAKLAGYAVRLSLISTERPRPRNPQNPKLGNKALVRAFPGQAIAAKSAAGALLMAVPLDVVEPEIEFVVRADLVPHPYSARVIATAFSQPFRLAVKPAATLTVDPKSQRLTGGVPGTVRGTIHRTPGFAGAVTIRLAGLPKSYQTKPVTIPAKKSDFAIPVTPAVRATPLPNAAETAATLTVTDRFGGALLPPRQLPLAVSPGPAKTAPVQAKKPNAKK
jgi:hypothetical protein